jgi:hypothetical protein
MNDCSNAEIRDQLPELLHDSLTPEARARVQGHVDECTDCRDELELLRCVLASFDARTPSLNVGAVVSALPKPGARVIPLAPRRRWADWRIAAAVTLLVAGGSSVAVLTNRADKTPSSGAAGVTTQRPAVGVPAVQRAPATVSPSAPQTVAEAPRPAVAISSAPTTRRDVATTEVADGRLAGLNEAQLTALLGEIDHLQPVPVTEPEPVSIRVTNNTGPEGGDL